MIRVTFFVITERNESPDDHVIQIRKRCRLCQRFDRRSRRDRHLPRRRLHARLPGTDRSIRQRHQHLQHLPRRSRLRRNSLAVRQPDCSEHIDRILRRVSITCSSSSHADRRERASSPS